jgi:hypothetical protein
VVGYGEANAGAGDVGNCVMGAAGVTKGEEYAGGGV